MKALLIGCGEGGSRLTEAIMKIQCATFGCDNEGKSLKKQFDAILINTTNDDLEDIDKPGIFIDGKRKLLIGTGYSETSGHGSGGNPRLGTLAANHDWGRIAAKIEEVLSEINRNPDMNDIDAFFVISALGGGSGSGMGPVIAKVLKDHYFESQYPVIGIVTLPPKEEGQLNAYNGYISLQSWLKESNFDGIITISLGGKFRNYRDESRKYYSKFNKAVATSLYILFGGEATGKKSSNVDMNDLLSTIREGGGLCTIGHLSTKFITPIKEDIKTPLLTHEETESLPEGWETEKLLKAVERVCNSNNLFLPVDFKTARTALLVVKDSTTFKVTRGAVQEAGNWLERNIQGHVRTADINHEGFRLITDNSRGNLFDELFEVSPEDKELSANETVEIVLLLSGISNVHVIQKMRETAEKVIRFTNPSRGERLLAETLGLSIGEKIDRAMLLPCSNERDNEAAQSQSRATTEALARFMEDFRKVDDTIPEERLRKGVQVTDIRNIPAVITCERPEAARENARCYLVSLAFRNHIDATQFKKDYVLRVIEHEKKSSDIGTKITWENSEFIQEKPGWSPREQRVADEVRLRAEADKTGNPRIAGIGPYPACSGIAKQLVHRVRVRSDTGVSYYYWIEAYPDAVILSEKDEMEIIRNAPAQREIAYFFDLIYEREEVVPSTEKIKGILQTLGVRGG
ncbi:MAG: hypothetical protein KA091_02365 [Methanoregulaceae archaeon]|nr:hypothetical protein [Methanoregulaceae archaeon]